MLENKIRYIIDIFVVILLVILGTTLIVLMLVLGQVILMGFIIILVPLWIMLNGILTSGSTKINTSKDKPIELNYITINIKENTKKGELNEK